MKILHVMQSRYSLPPLKYGGTERVVWYLAQEQQKMGHEVRYLWGNVPNLPDNAIRTEKHKPVESYIDDWADIVHFHRPYDGPLHKPYVCTEHGNADKPKSYSQNCIFLSRSHANNHGATCFVYNGLDWKDYGEANISSPKNYFHFLGKTKAPLKNLAGTVQISRQAGVDLHVLGGNRFNIRKLPYFYPSPSIKFHGMVGGEKKMSVLRHSKGLIFPVTWHEPFGLAITESLYFGAPVIATPFGSLPEIISIPEIGCLSDSYSTLTDAVVNVDRYSRQMCHDMAVEKFSSYPMAVGYQQCYEKVLAGETLNASRPETQGGLLTPLAMRA
ncbi:glycosyltransferase family 4 protein [Aliiglaciecola sp. LCG003]|uniref:glycosyltransferase family 4 protein n=1 Tax=Aliiglaciecola sp. LCG003 TaxID=3053655 RepID=UPI002573E284|nr:glycosyltransferase family 4 protein [Aliiglaciecola sp. LCG003]WJG09858.1 glycosyltransferase family 4 protein [Aliiglaciecola sp. LCG003]